MRPETSSEVYARCEREGFIVKQEEVDTEKIRHMVSLSDAELRMTVCALDYAKENAFGWSVVYRIHYDAFHQLAEAFTRFDRIKTGNHQCLFANLCEKHPDLELNWDFLEKIRTKRNGIQYYGKPVTFADWKEMEVPIKIYIATFKKAIEEKLAKTD
jgi:hypothetical protein